ncbi:acyl-CoA dehydrogenase [Sphingobacteriales bacterium UPWRP_1]|nr:acyl-CoA dehydrogenase [Sphingobacteriales bacterium TSM_CSS]PSJ73147.1 acyl-CoA dehydrogenase [Sphingobacteriales bacterium UPWRP_1]
MLFSNPQFEDLKEQVRRFLQHEIYPLEKDLLSKPFAQMEPVLMQKRDKVRQMGLLAPHMPPKYGGTGLSLVELAQIGELLGTTPYGHFVFNCHAPDAGNMELLAHHASDELKEKYLLPLVKGEIRSCFSMTEPEYAGSNPLQMATKAVVDNDHYIINGHKWFTTAAQGAQFAVVMAVTNAQAQAYNRAAMIIVPTDTEGFELVRNLPVMGETGSGYASHAEIKYHNCRVPVTNRIGADGSGFMLAQERLGPGRIHHCMRWIGICERSFDLMCRYAATRQIDQGVMLGHKQTIQNWIAESRAEINAARLMVLHTAFNMQQHGAKVVRNEIAAIKFYVANVLQQVLDRALQTHGALGLTDDMVLAYWYRHERAARIYDGPDEVHKSSLARSILKQYGLDIKA